jgi:hypothetical protein
MPQNQAVPYAYICAIRDILDPICLKIRRNSNASIRFRRFRESWSAFHMSQKYNLNVHTFPRKCRNMGSSFLVCIQSLSLYMPKNKYNSIWILSRTCMYVYFFLLWCTQRRSQNTNRSGSRCICVTGENIYWYLLVQMHVYSLMRTEVMTQYE